MRFELLIGLLCVALTMTGMGKQETEDGTGTYKDLTMTIDVAQSEIFVGEPLVITITVKNETDRKIRAWDSTYDLTRNMISVMIRKDDGKSEFAPYSVCHHRRMKSVDPDSHTKTTYEVGDQHIFQDLIFPVFTMDYPFREPATYEIKVKYEDGEESLESGNTWRISVVAPQREDDKVLSRLFVAYQDTRFEKMSRGLLFPLLVLGKEEDEYGKLIAKYPDSRFTKYLKYFLAGLLWRKDARQEARQIYEELYNSKGDFVLKPHCYTMIPWCYRGTSESDKADALDALAKEKYPLINNANIYWR